MRTILRARIKLFPEPAAWLRRPDGMLRSFLLAFLLLQSLLLSACAGPAAPVDPPLHALIQTDCAPWDGAAFTLSVPFDTGRLVRVSIFKSPGIQRRTSYRFPDSTGRVGNASYHPEFGSDIELGGMITFESVQAGMQVQGEFDLQSSDGLHLRGRFEATWLDRQALCG